MKWQILLVTTAVIYLSQGVGGSKILGVFWTPSKSHHILGSALLQALAKKGHNVTLLSPFIDDVDIPTFKQVKLTGIEDMMSTLANPKITFFQATKIFLKSIRPFSEKFWQNQAIQQLISSKEHFDVILFIPVLNDSLLGLYHYLGAPVIIFNPSGGNSLVNKYVANPTLSSSVNLHMNSGSPETFFGRLHGTTLVMYVGMLERYMMGPVQEEVMLKYIPGSPPISKLVKNVSLVLVNSHLSIEPPRLHGTTVVMYVGMLERYMMEPVQEEVMLKYIPGSPPISELVKNVSLVLVNSHLSIEPPRLHGTTVVVYFGMLEIYMMGPVQEEVMLKYLPGSPLISELVKNVSLVLVNSHLSIEPPR